MPSDEGLPVSFRINPAFRRFPKEAALIGHLLSAFGEIEVMVCSLASQALPIDNNTILKSLYGIRATSTRISTADRLMRPEFEKTGLLQDYETAIAMVWHCHQIRNQFAHCNWGDHHVAGLFFANLDDAAERANFALHWNHIDPPLLELHDQYFWQTVEQLRFVEHELAVKQGRLSLHYWPRPTIPERPPLHNDPEAHPPLWLSANEQALHIARARAAKGGDPTPTPAQQALDKARAEKRARQEEQRRKSREGEQNAKERSDPPNEQ